MNNLIAFSDELSLAIADEGVKSLAALPLLNYLKKSHKKIDFISGSGGGAVLGALSGMNLDESQIISVFEQLFSRENIMNISYASLLKIVSTNYFGVSKNTLTICKNKKLLRKFRSIFKDLKLQDLKPKLIVQTTMLADGSAHLFEEGPLAEILYASNALYPLMPPIEIDENYYVSGVYSSALPILSAMKNTQKFVLGVNFSYPAFGEAESYFEYWMNLFHRSYVEKELKIIQSTLSIKQDRGKLFNIEFDKGISIWNVSNIPYILEQGQKALKEKIYINVDKPEELRKVA
jgi:NTE family protein